LRIENERERRWGPKDAIYGWILSKLNVFLSKDNP
jgi:hypothetical protein